MLLALTRQRTSCLSNSA